MRVEVNPRRLSAVPGREQTITVTVTNTSSIISGHSIRLLGVDPQWVGVDQTRLSLFPDTSGVAVVTVRLPSGIPAGSRQLDVEVVEETGPGRVSRTSVELSVPTELHLGVALDPVSATGGRAASVGVLVENTGNSVVDVDLAGRDEEGAVVFAFTPEVPTLAPGEQIVGTARLRAPRPWFGSHKVRTYTIEAGPKTAPVIAYGSWVQTPRLTRGKLALFGLLAAATVFAIVIAATLSGLGHKSNQDLALALQVAQASSAHSSGGTSGISGTVRQLSSHSGVGGVTVTLYLASDTSDPVVSTASGATGGYHFGGLASGAYKVEYDGSGFTELWYPQSLGAADARAVDLRPGELDRNVDVFLGGVPATISGTVVGADPTGATLTLEVPPTSPPASPASPSEIVPAVVTTETLDATGAFDLVAIPSPAVYDLVVTKTGYATTTQQVDLGGGEDRSGLTLQLHKGDGSITGTVTSDAGGLDGATISASDSTSTISTISLTKGAQVGTFVLDGLPTPDTLTLLVSHGGFASQTISVSLAAAQQLTGLAVDLTAGVGSISGTIATPAGSPAGGVTVQASNGNLSKTTVTASTGKVGSFTLAGLPVPASYTVTFSRADLESQTRAVALTSSAPDSAHVDARLSLDTSTVRGIVSQDVSAAAGSRKAPVGNVTVLLDSGTTSYTVTTATRSAGRGAGVGSYEIQGVAPGTYTVSFSLPGVIPYAEVILLTAGKTDTLGPTLEPSASIVGKVVFAGTSTPAAGASVDLYLTAQYPSVVSGTATIGTSGTFTFDDVEAPASYIVGVAYPAGTPDQESVVVTTLPQQPVYACQGAATGSGTTTTTTVETSTTAKSTTTTQGDTRHRGRAHGAPTGSGVTGPSPETTTSLPAHPDTRTRPASTARTETALSCRPLEVQQ